MKTEAATPEDQKKGWQDAILVVSLQVFGIGGAVGLGSILQGVIFWKGVFLEAVAWWDAVVRPLADRLFSWAFDLIDVPITDFWKDWLAIGTIVGLGFLRHFVLLAYKQSITKPDDEGRLRALQEIVRRRNEGENIGLEHELIGKATTGPLVPPFLPFWTRISPLIYFFLSPLFWPLLLLLYIADTIRSVWPPHDYDTKRFILYAISTVILPFYWLLIGVALNEYVL